MSIVAKPLACRAVRRAGLLLAALLVGLAALPADVRAQLTPDEREELRRKVEDQLREQKEGQPLPADQLKQLQDDLRRKVDEQSEQSRRRQPRHDPEQYRRIGPAILAAFRDVVAEAAQSTVGVVCDGKEVALGTIVGEDGWILTKASELKNQITCRLHDGRQLPASLVGADPKNDLAMLKIEAAGLRPVGWSTAGMPDIGHWVATAGMTSDPVAIGVVSVAPRRIGAPSGILGITLDQSDDGPKIIEVLPDSGAAKAGLQVEDVVLAINGQNTATREEVVRLVGGHQPGQTVRVLVRRAGQELSIRATLGRHPSGDRSNFQNNLGGRLSERRANFPMVLQHDSVLRPEECGGPLVDLDGRVVGINIARAGRVESYAIPSEVVVSLLGELMSGKLAPPPEITKLEEQLIEAVEALQRAEAAVQDAKSELERVIGEAQSALKKVDAARSATERAVREAHAALEHAKQQTAPSTAAAPAASGQAAANE